uniref:Uncharacterized protein n=1 Tax=Iridovirus LCIVAC01 TaxID=2506607 RepID=A0A481YQ71_9VIRU|nr:MAG: hypothetical protein LCIVAC01_01410 [Iridovirus LCIVAC01]
MDSKQIDEIIFVIQKNNISKKRLKNIINTIPRSAINQSVPTYGTTFLGIAVRAGNFTATRALIEIGIRANGLVPEGYPVSVPISLINTKGPYFKDILILLLKKGADINSTGIDEKTLLYNLVNDVTTRDWENKVYFILTRGADPNRTKSYIPLESLIKSQVYTPESKRIVEMLLGFGANPKRKNIYGKIISNRVPKFFNFIKQPLRKLIKDCDNPILISQIARMLKIPLGNRDLEKSRDRKLVCKTIGFIYDMKNDINYENIRKIRTKRRKIKSANEVTIMGDEINEFTSDEIISFREGKIRWYFHVSAIPYLLQSKINPYTMKPLPKRFTNKMIKIKFVRAITLKESLTDLKEYATDTESRQAYRLSRLRRYLEIYSPYTSVEHLVALPNSEIKQLIYALPGDIRVNSKETTNDKLIKILLENYFNLMIKEKVSLPQIVIHIERAITNYHLSREIVEIIDPIFFKEIKQDLNIPFHQLYFLLGEEKFIQLKGAIQRNVGDNYEEHWNEVLLPFLVRYQV